jgi:hypothetical protein
MMLKSLKSYKANRHWTDPLVLSYEGQFTNGIPFDASASHVKSLLEAYS